MKFLNLCGLIAPIWLVIGVMLTATMYPGYSHMDQALSELHAMGSPVAAISPFINNYPLGALFIGFGVFVIGYCRCWTARLSGLMIILHGIGSWIAGAFPCDVGCNPDSTLESQQIHGIGAVLMTVSFLIAPAMWVFLARQRSSVSWFGFLSAATVVAQFIVFSPLATSLESGSDFGFYQRVAYAIPMVWLFIFAALLKSDKIAQSRFECVSMSKA
ncbi:Uncharacterised protein [BD1-7 clade bacterium]|uniref:DUF998 domain-containing protein n=1 Tax=BD1-7 clade bacterium TaxID=2029982 RepID=A0A5S9Q0U8_9GAMM|nr:Uncharacterised protein [BD1-7 clade bacterium]CAA0112336.1 Uncharacterised protein [BD1-7 clade bacterium]